MTDNEIPENYTVLDHAIRKSQESERPFYESQELLKQAAKDLGPLLANRMQYINAKRGLKIIAAQPCETDWRTYADPSQPWTCEDAVAAMPQAAKRCWPCYARHVLNGGTP